MKQIKFGTLLIASLISVNAVIAQKITVRNKASYEPVNEVFIFDKKMKTSTLSNEKGIADLSEFNDDDTLIFQHPSYKRLIIAKAKASERMSVVLNKSVVSLKEFVFSASRSEETVKDVPQTIKIIDRKEIEYSNQQTTADLLQAKGGVLVQKSQAGGGSPIIRGFEANKVLLVVDGVRMNNAIYRSGHLQNSITIDNSILERAEVLFGPNSLIYGSDALGGVMAFYTRNPDLATNDTTQYHVNAYTRYATANSGFTSHADVNIGFKKIGILSSITTSNFGDIRMGDNRHEDYPDFGKIPFYAARQNGKDTMLVNNDPNIQKPTGYKQTDFLTKLFYKPTDKYDLTLNTQYSTSSDIPRFDVLNDYNGNELKWAEWYYGPQERLLVSLKNSIVTNNKLFNIVNVTAAFQDIQESRISRRFGRTMLESQVEDVLVYSLNADFIKRFSEKSKVNYGMEGTYNDVASTAVNTDIETGERKPGVTRYPDAGSAMQTAAVYISYKTKFGEKLKFNAGVRYSYIASQAQYDDTSLVQLPFTEVNFSNSAPTVSAGLIYNATETWQFNTVIGTGFRAPNVDDFGKIRSQNERLQVPNDVLQPEYTYSGELGTTKTFDEEKSFLTGTVFYTLLEDAIVRQPYQLNDEDSIVYDGELNEIQTNLNASQAVIYGYSLSAKWGMTDEFSVEGSYNYTYGQITTDDTPLAHIPPVYGRAAFNYEGKKFRSTLYSMYNGWKTIDRYALSGEDNEEEATVDGTPAWYTLNLSNSYELSEYITLQLAVENILDKHYKPFASGISAPGRNFVATVRAHI